MINIIGQTIDEPTIIPTYLNLPNEMPVLAIMVNFKQELEDKRLIPKSS